MRSAPGGRARWLVRTNALVVAWLGLAVVVAVGHRWIPAASWLMTHLLLLGAASTALLIWTAHFAQALGRRPLPGGTRQQAVRLALHTLGAVAVVTGLVTTVGAAVTAGAAIVAGTVLWHAAALVGALRGGLGGRLSWTTWAFVASALALPVGAFLGRLLVSAGGELAGRAYVGHVASMLLGWVGLAVVGTLVTLWPTMLRVQLDDAAERAGRRGLVVLAGSLAVQVAGTGIGWRWLLVAGLAGYVVGLVVAWRPHVAQVRRRPPEGFAPWSVGAGLAWLAGAVGVWAAVAATSPTWATLQGRTGALVAPLAVGFTGQVLLGSLAHLGPMALGGGPGAVRAARDVVDRGAGARLVLANGGLLLFVLPAPSLVRVAASMLALVALAATPALLVRAAVVARRARRSAEASGTRGLPVAVPGGLEAPRRRHRRSALAGGVALAVAVAGAVAADPAAAGLGAAADAGVAATGRVVEVEVVARDMRFEPASVTVESGDRLVVVLANADDVAHDLVLDSGASSGRVAPGGTGRLEVEVVGRALDGWCSVTGHRQMGMTFRVEVAGAETAGTGPAPGHDGGHQDPAAAPSAAEDLDLMADPGLGFEAYDAALPPAPDAAVHRVRLEVTEVEREVAPGVRQTVWTFGGTAPGPVLRGRVGDRFEVTLVNDGTIGHSIDFHAGALAPAGPMRTIEPGEELTYTFTATRSGIWMYHCSTMPMSLHIANGMFGAVVIDPPDLPPVDREYLLVQSELYLGPQGGTADERAVADETPDAVAFNGYAAQYDHAPLPVRVGERVRIWVLDAGPNRATSFHVVGGQFETVFREGAWLLGGPGAAPTTGGAQALALQPAEGGFVELVLPEPGQYPFVSHVMVDAERGAHGLLDAR
ncbi:multicopper oxidase domain-containing protein [Actinotalea fermentans]|uniref:multicopper oxidase domain-containing protein n=1 Tax=Actinotalea fermentans TaxID=43671 RepID=UPI0011BE024A|nr:multicopper oxidase domain-containing protein [Actinotalea fermentans]